MQYRMLFVLLALAAVAVLVGTAGVAQAETYKGYVLADGPSYYWTWDEASGAAANYGGGGGGTLAGDTAASRVASTTNKAGLSLGKAAYCGDAAGYNWYSERTGGSSLTDGNYTAYINEFWFKPAESTIVQYLSKSCDKVPSNWYSQPSIVWDFPNGSPATNNWVEVYTQTPTGTTTRTSDMAGAQLADDMWYHVVWGYQDKAGTASDRVQLCINGVNQGQLLGIVTEGTYRNGAMMIGNAPGRRSPHSIGANYFRGLVDEWAVYNLSDLVDNDVAFDAKMAQICGHYSIPEPATLVLLATGLLGLLCYAWRKRK